MRTTQGIDALDLRQVEGGVGPFVVAALLGLAFGIGFGIGCWGGKPSGGSGAPGAATRDFEGGGGI